MKLVEQRCIHGAPALSAAEAAALLAQLPAWRRIDGRIERAYAFKDYHETIAFVNALAWMTHQQDHHPELAVTYNSCTASYSTHSAGGKLTGNDFICAARADALYAQRAGA